MASRRAKATAREATNHDRPALLVVAQSAVSESLMHDSGHSAVQKPCTAPATAPGVFPFAKRGVKGGRGGDLSSPQRVRGGLRLHRILP